MALAPGTRVGSYEIVALVGQGGMGEVYRATDTTLKRGVAIKILRESIARDAQSLARFRREAEVLASLNHPHIAHVYGLEESGDVRALVMEFVEGPTLAERIARGPVPLDETLAIARQLTTALDAAHQRGVVHRDLKPANIKLRPDGTVKVLDFGLAKAADAADGPQLDATVSPTMTNLGTLHGMLMGTAAYMSPEQARGEAVDRRADIWAFGVVLHEMVTGRRLFDGRTVADTVAAVLVKDTDVSAAPEAIRPLLTACLERDVNRRLRDIGDAWLLTNPGVVTAPIAKGGSRTTHWLATAVLAVAAGVAGWIIARPAGAPVTTPVRWDVDLGSGISLPPVPNREVALSPDGTRLAYMALPLEGSEFSQTPGNGLARGRRGGAAGILASSAPGGSVGPPRVFVRQLDQPTATELAVTSRGSTPTFSPDGRWLAVGLRGQIHKVSLDGSVDIPLTPASLGTVRSIVWPEANLIFATLTQADGTAVLEVKPDDVMVRTVATISAGEYRITDALPGGTHLLATKVEGLPGQFVSAVDLATTVEVLSRSDGRRKPVIAGGSARYLPTGHLVFSRNGSLFGMRFDLKALEPRGDPVLLLDDLMFTRGGMTTYTVAENGTLVYRRGGESTAISASPRARLEWVDASGKRSPVIPTTGRYDRPRLSPDGSKLAILVSETGSRDEQVLDLASGRWNRITFGDLSVSTVAWSADSRYLFIGAGGTGLHWARADGAERPQTLARVLFPFVWSYSAGAKRLAYAMSGTTAGLDIASVELTENGGRWKAGKPELFMQSTFSEETPEFSPDGRWLAYTSDESQTREVYVRPFPPGRVGGKVLVSTGGGDNPRWSPSTNEILYSSGDKLMAVGYTQTGDTFAVAPRPRVRAENVTGPRWGWDVHPDGRILMVIPEETAPLLAQPSRTLAYIQNFFELVRQKVPGN